MVPLGVYAVTAETSPGSAVLQLAANKQGVLAGTYYTDTQANRPVLGMIDTQSARC